VCKLEKITAGNSKTKAIEIVIHRSRKVKTGVFFLWIGKKIKGVNHNFYTK